MKALVVAGCGLLGTSVAGAFRRAFENAFIVGVEPDDKSRRTAEALGLYSLLVESVEAARSALKESAFDTHSLVGVAATPPLLIASAMQQLAPFCTLVIDVGSIKSPIIEALDQSEQGSENLVPCHPMAGSHTRGPDAGMATLFDDRWVFVVPLQTSAKESIEAAHQFWRDLGAKTQQIDPAAHDEAVAHTSHLPHLLASAYMEVQPPEPAAAGTGFMDFTRLAKANPQMWSQILVANQAAWKPLLGRYIEILQQAEKLVESGDTEAVERWLEMRLAERLQAEPSKPSKTH